MIPGRATCGTAAAAGEDQRGDNGVRSTRKLEARLMDTGAWVSARTRDNRRSGPRGESIAEIRGRNRPRKRELFGCAATRVVPIRDHNSAVCYERELPVESSLSAIGLGAARFRPRSISVDVELFTTSERPLYPSRSSIADFALCSVIGSLSDHSVVLGCSLLSHSARLPSNKGTRGSRRLGRAQYFCERIGPARAEIG